MKIQPVVFITGASRGIGKALVEKFQAGGWRVAACATQEKSVTASGADLSFACDITDVKRVRTVIQSIIEKMGRLDAVINNAGIGSNNSLNVEDNDDIWHRIIDVNLNGTYYVSKYALPHLPNHHGRIVNISSVLGLKGVADCSAYCAAKHGVLGFTKSLAHSAAPRHITVNAICPGWVNTDMAQDRMQELNLSAENLTAPIPLKRFIEPQEVADLAFYLVTSKGAAGITGQTLTIDGGVLG